MPTKNKPIDKLDSNCLSGHYSLNVNGTQQFIPEVTGYNFAELVEHVNVLTERINQQNKLIDQMIKDLAHHSYKSFGNTRFNSNLVVQMKKWLAFKRD